MASFPVPGYLAETARRDQGVRDWIADLPVIVASLADRWSLHVGEPFQPGGQCSWSAPVTGPGRAGLMLKVAFRFPGGEERNEAAGLGVWDGTVWLHAACQTESTYALLIERCLPGIPLGQCCRSPSRIRPRLQVRDACASFLAGQVRAIRKRSGISCGTPCFGVAAISGPICQGPVSVPAV